MLEFSNGDLLESKDFNYKEYAHFKQKQFEVFIKTEEFSPKVLKLFEEVKRNSLNCAKEHKIFEIA